MGRGGQCVSGGVRQPVRCWGLVPKPLVIAPAGTRLGAVFSVLFLQVALETLTAAEIPHIMSFHLTHGFSEMV